MSAPPREPRFDSTADFLADPYRFIARRCRAHGSDIFEARIMLRRTLCLTGPLAAELFYDPERFQRRGAAPEPLRATLFGKGGVQNLDGEAHRRRKSLFMSAVAAERVRELLELTASQWYRQAREWTRNGPVVLYPALHRLLSGAVCAWAGVPLPEGASAERTRELVLLFDRAGEVGIGHFRARLARRRAEHWLAGLVRDIRAGRLVLPPEAAARAAASYREGDGALLAPRIAAVEILNLLRPTVAVSVFIVHAAHALHLHPECRQILRSGNPAYLEAFVQEVRRWYPFFPVVAAKVRRDFEWQGYRFQRGRRAMLDLHGTNRDPRSWDQPDRFSPERFLAGRPTPFNFVPQGGSEAEARHRCPGEGITVELMKQAVDFLVNRLRYRVPQQDLEIDYARLPALPRDGFVISDVRMR